ncbi:lipoprotein [Streptomyces longisporoflavus]|uniref:hypothetical protein n=1 Tax=Streptomyces longisporoflavus TaxID=28044 RepID=UPI00167DF0E4|nr:hypothetical protein [Streptomyces longisporoflavus]GGV31026.1 lipoprotein [Streptomyces longisporoflavus]
MNRRPTLLAATALTAAAVLSLSACGGGGDVAKENDKIAGAGTGDKRQSPTPTASDDGIERPEIKLPKDVRNVFEGGETGDAKKDAILADNERRITSIDEAITVDAEKHPALAFYSSGDALLSAANHVQGFYKKDKTFVGTTRYYDREVRFLKGGAAAVTYCEDTSKTYPKDRRTGKVDRSIPESEQDYAFYNTRLDKNENGVWQTTNVLTTTAAKRCMP